MSFACTCCSLANPSWGYPKGAHGRTSCHCGACLSHAANKIFATESAALAGAAHTGCLCVPFSVSLDTAIYDALFTERRADGVDRRDPDVEAILDPAPVGSLTGFRPLRGQVGHRVILTGSHLTGATRVMFGRVRASFTIDSDTQITTTVPDGATSGPILVRLAEGTFSSVMEYVVKHTRRVTLTMNDDATFGQVSVVDGYYRGRQDMPIVVERLHWGRWLRVARARTRPDGSFGMRAMHAPGHYRAVAPWVRLSTNDVCMGAVSEVLTRHNGIVLPDLP